MARGQHRFCGYQAAIGRERVDDVERCGDPLRGVDHGGDDGEVVTAVREVVAVRRLVAVEPPDAAHRGRATKAGRAQPADDDLVHRVAVVPCRLGRVDRQLDQGRHVGRCRSRCVPGVRELRTADDLPVPFTQADLRDRHDRMAEQPAQFGKEHRDPVSRSHRGERERRVRTVVQELSALSPPEVRAVDPRQHGSAGDSSPVQQVAGGLKGWHLISPFSAPAVHGQPRRLG